MKRILATVKAVVTRPFAFLRTLRFIALHPDSTDGRRLSPFKLGSYRDLGILRAVVAEIRESPWFDHGFYLQRNPDIEPGVDPAVHFLVKGWREGRDPSSDFDLSYYLDKYPDVAESGLNPLLHHHRYGRYEKRFTSPENAHKARIDMEVFNLVESGMFDAEYYRVMNPDLSPFPEDPIRHYCESGWREGRNPTDDFDGFRYLEAYPDVRLSDKNPFWYYVVTGGSRSLQPMPPEKDRFQNDRVDVRVEGDVGCVAFYARPDWQGLRRANEREGSTSDRRLPHPDIGFYDPLKPEVLVKQAVMARSHGVSAWCFTLAAGGPVPDGDPLEAFLSNPAVDLGLLLNVDMLSTHRVDHESARCIAKALGDVRCLRIDGRPAVLLTLPSDAEGLRSAWSLFTGLVKDARIPEAYLIARSDAFLGSPSFELSLFHGLDAILDFRVSPMPPDTGAYVPMQAHGTYRVPYNMVAMQAVASIGLAGRRSVPTFRTVSAGRDDRLLNTDRPFQFTRPNAKNFRMWLDAAIEDARSMHPIGRRWVFLDSWNDWGRGAALEPDDRNGFSFLNETGRALMGLPAGSPVPFVSILVPEAGKSPSLARRLENILSQTYLNHEVILLDDRDPGEVSLASGSLSDGCRPLFRKLVDPAWSGSVLRQWAAGIEAAQGDLIWIAGNDAECEPDFLEKMVQCFRDESVLLAHVKTEFTGRDGSIDPTGFDAYTMGTPFRGRRRSSYLDTAHREVSENLGILKTIANPSSAVFRRPVDMPLLEDEEWLSMRVLGDWVFHLHVIRGGRIAYSADTWNLCRRHEAMAMDEPVATEAFLREMNAVVRTVHRLYDVPATLFHLSRKRLGMNFVFHTGRLESVDGHLLEEEAVRDCMRARTPNIVVCTLRFFPGGAEILPIRMANEFKRTGHSVLLLSAGYGTRVSAVRRMLRNDIPVVETSDVGRVKETLSEFGAEVLNSHDWNIQKYPMRDADVFRGLKCHVASLHGMIENKEFFTVTREEIETAHENVTTWVYTADKNLQPFKDFGLYEPDPSRFVKLPNGMSAPLIKPVPRSELGIPDDAFVLCCVSRAVPDKGWPEAIESVERARVASGRDIRLILVGNGPLYDEYVQSGVPPFVCLVGFNENSVGFYASSDAGIMLTKYRSESFPLTVVDCFFAGRPYIATDLGEIREMLTVEGGLAGEVFELDDWEVPVDEVAAIVARFANDGEALRKVRDRVAAAADKYRIDAVCSRYEELFARDILAYRERD